MSRGGWLAYVDRLLFGCECLVIVLFVSLFVNYFLVYMLLDISYDHIVITTIDTAYL